jgi:NAD(P)-dependent dehydrogenase (short-subunit alcohol dehydrogenase family)
MAQRVLVTAGAGGIGQAIVNRFVAAGAQVHIADVDTGAIDRMRASQSRAQSDDTEQS